MSVTAIRSVLKYSEARLSARLVMLVLADAAHDDGVTWLGQKEIGAKGRISQAEVHRSLKELAEEGELEQRKAQRGRRRINVYRIVLPGLDEPRYEDMPFALDHPFTTSQDEGPSENDDLSSGRSTTSHLVDPSRARDPLEVLNRKGEPSDANASERAGDERGPPEVHLEGGRNVPLDALLEVCGIDPESRLVRAAAVCLNGDRRKGLKGVRELFWIEATRYAEEHGEVDRLRALTPQEFAEALERAIRRKARLFHEAMPGATLGPNGLADHWLDLENRRPAGRGVTTLEDIMRVDEAA